jgi:3-dehydroshikimate dehydratase
MDSESFLLTGFADEINPDIDLQIETMVRLNVSGLDLRSVDGVNVLDLNDDKLSEISDKLKAKNLTVSCIGSPVNKVPYSKAGQGAELAKLRKACHAAKSVGTDKVRLFTPEVPSSSGDGFTSLVLNWMEEQVKLAEDEGVILLHENDATFWGAYPENAKVLFGELGGPHFQAAFDFANTVLIGFQPMRDWFPWLRPYLHTLHIKDAIHDEHKVVPAGFGEGQIEETIRYLVRDGWRGPFTIEPHLQAAGPFGGFSGPELFGVAVDSFRAVLGRITGEAQ